MAKYILGHLNNTLFFTSWTLSYYSEIPYKHIRLAQLKNYSTHNVWFAVIVRPKMTRCLLFVYSRAMEEKSGHFDIG